MNVVDKLLIRYAANDVTKKKIKIYATDRMEIQGKLIIEGKSFDERVSDYLNDSQQLIAYVIED